MIDFCTTVGKGYLWGVDVGGEAVDRAQVQGYLS